MLQDDRKENVFEAIINSSKAQMEEEDLPTIRRGRNRKECTSINYRPLYFEIIDNIIQEIKTRYGSFSNLAFFHLLTHQKFEDYSKNFPDTLIASLETSYDTTFDYIRLKCELSVIYGSPEFRSMPIYKMVEFMKNNDLISGFKEVYQLAELILSIPNITSSVERSFSALKRILSFCRSTQGQDRLGALAIISIEKEILHKLRLNDSFYDRVLEKFL